MSEIKSTLDLVLERTRNMVQSDEEKRREKENEISAHAKGLALRLQEGRINIEELRQAVNDRESDDRLVLIKALIASLAQAIELEGDNEFTIEALETLVDKSRRADLEALKGFLPEYRDRKEKMAAQAGEKARQTLALECITGSAVHPNPAMFGEYFKEINTMEKEAQGRLAEMAKRFS